MGCGDSRTVSPEEEAVAAQERAAISPEVSAALVITTVRKYSEGPTISETQLMCIIQKLNPGLEDVLAYKHKYFGESFFHAQPTGFDRNKVTIFFILLCLGPGSEKTKEIMNVLDPKATGSVPGTQVEWLVRTIVSISVIYTPLLVTTTLPQNFEIWKRRLQENAEPVTRSVLAEAIGKAHSLSTATLAEKFSGERLRRFWTCGGVRRAILDSAETEAPQPTYHVTLRRGDHIAPLLLKPK